MSESQAGGRHTLVCAGLLGASAVAMGAFGAHALDGRLSERALDWYRTAVTYHTTHALALLACGLFAGQLRDTARAAATRALLRLAALSLMVGTLVFSGTLYVMSFTDWTRLGAVTPLGGIALIVGWLALSLAAWRRR